MTTTLENEKLEMRLAAMLLAMALLLPQLLLADEAAQPRSIQPAGGSPAKGLLIFGDERLASSSFWKQDYGCKFSPPSKDGSASLEFPPGRWTALDSELPLGKLSNGSFLLKLRYRWAGDFSNAKSTDAELLFEDGAKKKINDAGARASLKRVEGWQSVEAKAGIPAGAKTLRFLISSHGGGTIEIENCELRLLDADLTEMAIKGAELPWLNVPGGLEGRTPAAPDAAAAEFSAQDIFSFDAPFWRGARAYQIPATACNKTPPNGVSANFKLGWTDDNLYARFQARDSKLSFERELRYCRDCFELFLQPKGRFANGSVAGKEQYSVTRTATGETSANAEAITRLAPDGWEAILKIPLKTESRRIFPFNGLEMSFNAAYQDANTLPQEHWLSFSKKDQGNDSWHDTSLYVPLVFACDLKRPYAPLWLGDFAEYNVDPKFHGRINLVKSDAFVKNVALWHPFADAYPYACAQDGHACFRFKVANSLQNPKGRFSFMLSPFNVLPGETLDVEMEWRESPESANGAAPSLMFMTQSNWQFAYGSLKASGKEASGWRKARFSLKIPDSFREHLRNGRIMPSFPAVPGHVVEVRDIGVFRRLPVDFDAQIRTQGAFANLWSGEPNAAIFKFDSGKAFKAKISAEAKDFFTGRSVVRQEWEKELPAGASSLDCDLSSLPNGFFNVILKVRDVDGGGLATRELYVSKGTKAERPSSFSGMFFWWNLCSMPSVDASENAEILKSLGIGMVDWGNLTLCGNEGEELPCDPLASAKAFKKAGFITGSMLNRAGVHRINREWQPDELIPYYERSFKLCKGLFDFMNFQNEANLDGGDSYTGAWNPVADGREWALYNRAFYNALKRIDPACKPILGAFNRVPIDFVKAAADENMNSFADGVSGVHLYGVEVNGDGFKHLLDSRTRLEKLHPGWEAWDTESGLVHYDHRSILDLQSKKAPIAMCAGYSRSFFYQDFDLIFPRGDSTPLMPMESFKNRFYLDAEPLGRLELASGKVHLYLFKRKDGVGAAAFWNTIQGEAAIELPALEGCKLFDVFGNQTGTSSKGPLRLVLKNRFLNYVDGVDANELSKASGFIAAFKPSQSIAAFDKGYSTEVYLSLQNAVRAFDLEVQQGTPSLVAAAVHNESASEQRVKLACPSCDGLLASFDGGSEIVLKPGEAKAVSLRLLASKEVARQPFSLTASLASGERLLPLAFSVKTSPAVDVSGGTRALVFKNNSASAVEMEAVPSKSGLLFKPAALNAKLAPHSKLAEPIELSGFESLKDPLNSTLRYSLSVKSPQGSCAKDCGGFVFSPRWSDGQEPDFAHLPFSAISEQAGNELFQADYDLRWTGDGSLRIIARVRDSSPEQDREGGDLKNGGDCMIVAFDSADGSADRPFGSGYFECGFAFGKNGPASYSWNGKYGMEAAKPFPSAVKRISRDANFICYDVSIDGKLIFKSADALKAGMSIVFVDRKANGENALLKLGGGVMPERAPAEMGLLIKQK